MLNNQLVNYFANHIMFAYLKKFVKRVKIPLNPPFLKGKIDISAFFRKEGFEILNKPKSYLLVANILLVFFLILLSNMGILPFKDMGDFGFFAVIFLILALYRPGWSFLFFIGTIALENINLAPENLGIAIRPYQFIGALTILAVLIRLVSKRLNLSLPKISWLDKAIIIFVVAGFVSILGAMDKSLSLKYSVIIFSFASLYFLARLFIQNLDDVKKILPFFLSSSAVVILYGIWQNVRFMKGLSNFEVMPGRPNATFAEADWLGMYLVLILAIVYSLIFYFYKTRDNTELKISSFSAQGGPAMGWQIPNSKFQIPIYLLLTTCYILLILTVSRSAWLGAIVVSIMYLVFTLSPFGKELVPSNDWEGKRLKRAGGFEKRAKLQWRRFFRQLRNLAIAGFCSLLVVWIFNLTNFELGNRLQSAGSGLQEITISCENNQQPITDNQQQLPKIIKNISELQQYNCYHINLENIEKEKMAGHIITTIYRDDPNVNIRAEIYRKSWEEIKKHTILGIGWGNISQVLGIDERGAGLNSSNIFLEVWLGSGILGLMAFVFVWGNILFTSYKLQATSYKLFLVLSLFAIIIPNLFNAGIMLGFLWVWLAVANIKQFNNETI